MPPDARQSAAAIVLGAIVLAASVLCVSSGAPARTAVADDDRAEASERRERRARVALKRWNAGPARYLLTYDEHSAYKNLDNDRDRLLFITKFWSRWDPSPGTLLNENRRDFWWRIQQANRRFRDTTRPGWMTDRGKTFILLGEPDEIIKDERQSLLRWTYFGLPSPTANPITHIAFRRDEALEWRTSTNAADYSPVFPGLSTSDPNDPSFVGPPDGVLEQVNDILELRDQGLDVQVALDLAEAIRVPDPIEEAADLISATEFIDRFPLTTRLAFFRTPEGGTHVRIGASVLADDLFSDETIPPDAQTYLLLFARFEGPGDSGTVTYASNENDAIVVSGQTLASQTGLSLTAWASRTLPPGRYLVSLGLQDVATGQVSSRRSTIEVPSLDARGLTLSSLLPASSLDVVDGRLRPVPRVDARFPRDGSIRLYYEIYGTPGAAAPTVDLAYRFFLKEAGGERPVALAEVRESTIDPTQGFSLPLDRFPAGNYRVEVIAREFASGRRASGSLDFEVVETR